MTVTGHQRKKRFHPSTGNPIIRWNILWEHGKMNGIYFSRFIVRPLSVRPQLFDAGRAVVSSLLLSPKIITINPHFAAQWMKAGVQKVNKVCWFTFHVVNFDNTGVKKSIWWRRMMIPSNLTFSPCLHLVKCFICRNFMQFTVGNSTEWIIR